MFIGYKGPLPTGKPLPSSLSRPFLKLAVGISVIIIIIIAYHSSSNEHQYSDPGLTHLVRIPRPVAPPAPAFLGTFQTHKPPFITNRATKPWPVDIATRRDPAYYPFNANISTTSAFDLVTKYSKTNVTAYTAKGNYIPPRYALFSSTAAYRYAFFLPLTSLIWVHHNMTPVVLLAGPDEEWNTPLSVYILAKMKEVGAQTVRIGSLEGMEDGEAAQVSRICGGLIPLQGAWGGMGDGNGKGAWLLTTDLDIWPFRKELFDNVDYTKDMVIFESQKHSPHNVSAADRSRYPMTYYGGYHSVWKTLIPFEAVSNAKPSTTIPTALTYLVETHHDLYLKDPHAFDERIANLYLRSLPSWPHAVQFVNRWSKRDRLGRTAKSEVWEEVRAGFVRPELIDAHVRFGEAQDAQYGDMKELRVMVEHIVGRENMDWVDQYLREVSRLAVGAERPEEIGGFVEMWGPDSI
ncbi:hypothetical protein HK097_004948 [Rhizophlyctis rosea]|uniref:Uncharacterized protein n=1 Tax=Rhizophlyctis rosea TaxID=64517 RepID=A0AAD5SEK8_9FUNG|nr:hypothetical protein HK097_004948 [Rhizophlyctis rosea]